MWGTFYKQDAENALGERAGGVTTVSHIGAGRVACQDFEIKRLVTQFRRCVQFSPNKGDVFPVQVISLSPWPSAWRLWCSL